MAIVLDDQDRVLLIQEAKKRCRGQWYIPAGRVEPGENFIVSTCTRPVVGNFTR